MKKLIITLALVIGMVANAQKTSTFYFFVDLTHEPLIQSYVDLVKAELPSILKGTKSGNGVVVHLVPITNFTYLTPKTIKLAARDIPWYENEYLRQDELSAFKASFEKGLKVFDFGDGYPNTRIYEELLANMKDIKDSKATVMVLSDLYENAEGKVQLHKTYPRDVSSQYDPLFFDDITIVQGITKGDDPKNADYVLKFWRTILPGTNVDRFKL